MKLALATTLMVIAGCVFLPAGAQERIGMPPAAAPTARVDDAADARDFGPTGSFYSAVDAYAMKPWSNLGEYVHSAATGGIFCSAGSPERRVIGQIVAPHGVRIRVYRAWLHDESADDRILTVLEEACLPDFAAGQPALRNLATVSTTVAYSSLTGFSASDLVPANTLVDNQSCTLRVRATLGLASCQQTGDFGFYKGRIEWERYIPPAPALASFTDVPSNDPFFQVVEALKASGVTAGCTGTEFCPGQAVTRAQMAAFLARALGLPVQTLPDSANP